MQNVPHTQQFDASNVPNIPMLFLDMHSKTCEECKERLTFMRNLYSMDLNPQRHFHEFEGRDEMLDEMITECRICFAKTVRKLQQSN